MAKQPFFLNLLTTDKRSFVLSEGFVEIIDEKCKLSYKNLMSETPEIKRRHVSFTKRLSCRNIVFQRSVIKKSTFDESPKTRKRKLTEIMY